MDNPVFNYQLADDTVFFTDTLYENSPYIPKVPRNHESLFIVTNGTLLYENNGVSQTVCKGQVGYIARGALDKSSAFCCREVSYIAVNFCTKTEKLTASLPFDTLCSRGDDYNYEKLFRQALNDFLSKTPGFMTICNGILAQIIGLLYNEYRLCGADYQKMQRLKKPLEYLKEHYDDPNFKVSRLCKIADMSEKNFRRIFLSIYGKTPYRFLLEFRINKAEILLLNTSKSLSDIALYCGFSDVYSFSHSFKKHKGVSPGKYRAEL